MKNTNTNTNEITFLGLGRTTLGVMCTRWRAFVIIIMCSTLVNLTITMISQQAPIGSFLRIVTAYVLSMLSITLFSLLALLTVKEVFGGLGRLSYRQYVHSIRQYYRALFATTLMKFFIIGAGFLLIIPGLIYSINYLFVEAVVVFEDEDGLQALKRSTRHIDGQFSRCAGYLCGLYLLLFGYGFINAGLAAFSTTATPPVESVTFIESFAFGNIESLTLTFFYTWWAVAYMALKRPEQFYTLLDCKR
jgi:hypothetical protein